MSSFNLYQSFLRKGLSKEQAFFALIDHHNHLHWSDRDRYGELVKKQADEINELKSRLFRLETRGQGE